LQSYILQHTQQFDQFTKNIQKKAPQKYINTYLYNIVKTNKYLYKLIFIFNYIITKLRHITKNIKNKKYICQSDEIIFDRPIIHSARPEKHQVNRDHTSHKHQPYTKLAQLKNYISTHNQAQQRQTVFIITIHKKAHTTKHFNQTFYTNIKPEH